MFRGIFYSKVRAASIHFIATFVVSLGIAFLVWYVWFPAPFSAFSGGGDLWRTLVLAELVLGPIVILIVYSPIKSKRELLLDYGVVALFQISALFYGIYSIYLARPLALVFVKDRFELVTVSDLVSNSVEIDPTYFSAFSSPKLLEIRYPEDVLIRNKILLESALGGADYHLRPAYYSLLSPERLKVIGIDMVNLCAQQKYVFIECCNEKAKDFRWLPVRNGIEFGVVILDVQNHAVVNFYDVDPWFGSQ